MNSVLARRSINQTLVLYSKILNDGGTYAFSPQYRHFILRKNFLLKLFQLPATEENLRTIFAYPMSQFVNFDEPSPEDEGVVIYSPLLLVHMYKWSIIYGNDMAKPAENCWWTINQRVEFSFQNLLITMEEFRDSQEST